MIPHVSTPAQAESLVHGDEVSTAGRRGYDGAGRDASFWFGAPKDYVAQANAENVFCRPIETQKRSTTSRPSPPYRGVDVLFIGPGDLSLRLGCSPGVNDPMMMEAQQELQQCETTRQKPGGVQPAVRDADHHRVRRTVCRVGQRIRRDHSTYDRLRETLR